MLEAIYASKMFLASRNQDKVKSAIMNPLNGELVQQLRSYLDDDFLRESAELHEQEKFAESLNELDDVPDDGLAHESFDDFTENAPSFGEPSRPSSHSAPSHSMTEDFDSLMDEGVPDANDSIGDMDMDTESMPEDTSTSSGGDESSVEESTRINKKSISSSKDIMPDLMAILNSSDITKGVRRVNATQDSELWIYYNDDVNLNHVMESVISSVNTCCPNVEFSRLARTYNAVVFSV